MKILLLLILIYLHGSSCLAQDKPKSQYIYKKDTAAYREIIDEYWDPNKNVTMIIKVSSSWGNFFWFFEKEIKEETRVGQPNDTLTIKYHNLYAYLMLEDHGGLVQVAKFQDFGNEVYFPEFQYPYCLVDDADNDGVPEFYLTYFGLSDGLDEKPLKLIIYSSKNVIHSAYVKSKATAWYPGGNEDDSYRIEYDANWNKLQKSIQVRGMKILNEIKNEHI